MTAMMEWNEALALGNDAIDRDHRKLVGLINKLGEAMSAGQGREVCAHVLDELADYARYHFATEERLMAQHRYPGEAMHRAEHAKAVMQVDELRRQLASGTVTVAVPLLRFLMEWLSRHILEVDRALVQALPRN